MVPLLPAPTARQPSGAAATQAAADLQGLTASIKQTERLLHELCITHQVPIALEDCCAYMQSTLLVVCCAISECETGFDAVESNAWWIWLS
eukprot:6460841-Amphidinium_carterae.1